MKRKSTLIIVVLFLSMMTGCVTQVKKKQSYVHELKEERYAPDFELKKGLTYYSIIQKNDENILLFWSVICPHCEKVIDFIKAEDHYEKLKDAIFTVSIDETLDDIKTHEKDFSIYLDYNYKVFKSFECEHIPMVYIINSKGKILAVGEGREASIALINEFIDHNN